MAEAELTTIARPYARAAFSYALSQPEGLGQWSNMLKLLAAAIDQSIVREALDDPMLTMGDETALVFDIMGDDLTDEGKNFVSILAEYGRLSLIPTISEMFELLKSHHEKTMEVEVTSAFEVSDQERTNLAGALNRMLQRNINLETKVDTDLIGGVVIKAEDTVIDDSIRGRLTKLSQALH